MNADVQRLVGRRKHQPFRSTQHFLKEQIVRGVEEILARRGLTKGELAKLVGVTNSGISQILDPEKDMMLRSLANIVDALDLEVEINLLPRVEGEESGVRV